MTTTLAFAACLIASYFGVAAVRAWSRRKDLLDIPNERSSHTEPTPRGGGIAIVGVSLAFYLAASYFMPWMFSWGYLAGAVLVAGISLIDDIYNISVVWRLLMHSAAAILVIADRGWLQRVYVPGFDMTVDLYAAGPVITFIWIVWLVNAYNFMDGIDGIAGVQAVAGAAGWMAVGWLTGSTDAFYLGGAILFSSLGFLIHNWQPASIFMGDVGSAFLGFSFAALPLLARPGVDDTDKLLPLAGVLFVWLFVLDTIVTLFRRILRREKIWRAHRLHIYQRLVQTGWSHAAASALYGLLALIITVATVYMFTSEEANRIVPLVGAALATFVLLSVYLWKVRSAKIVKATR